MKVFSIYLFCIALLSYQGFSIANNIKKDLLNQSNQINQAVTSYSQYLQTLNYYYDHNIYMYNYLFAWLINYK